MSSIGIPRQNSAESTCSSVGKSNGFLIQRGDTQYPLFPPENAGAPRTLPDQNEPSGGLVVGVQLRLCAHCHQPFRPVRARPSLKNSGMYCSRACAAKAPRNRSKCETPPSTPAQRIAANALINMRERRGWFTRPKVCMVCRAHGRTDFHHHDYSRPDAGFWLCRSCHMKVHHGHPHLLDGREPWVSPSSNPNHKPYVPTEEHLRRQREGIRRWREQQREASPALAPADRRAGQQHDAAVRGYIDFTRREWAGGGR